MTLQNKKGVISGFSGLLDTADPLCGGNAKKRKKMVYLVIC